MTGTWILRRLSAVIVTTVMLITAGVVFSVPASATHRLSYVKVRSGYYVLYDTSGHEYQSVSTGRTRLVGWSETHFVVSDDKGYYIVYDASGRRVSQLSASRLGTVTDVLENAIISQKDGYIYRWDVFGSRRAIISSS